MLLLKDIRKSFVEPDGTAAQDPGHRQFQVAAGEQVVLTGQSGSGKTTLLHMIAGISRPDGRVEVDGRTSPGFRRPAATGSGPKKWATCFKRSICWPVLGPENVMLGMTFAGGRPDAARARASAGAGRLAHG